MNFERAFTTVIGKVAATKLAGTLLAESAYYEVTPLPDDEFQFAVKADRKELLLDVDNAQDDRKTVANNITGDIAE